MSSDKVILYDLPSKDKNCTCWSPNPWKTRLALNFKGIPYETQWVEYPDVAPLLKSFGLAPQEGKIAPYTIPTVRFPQDGGKHVMNSEAISEEIERRYPSPQWPSLHLDDPVLPRVYAAVKEAFLMRAALLPPVPRDILNAESAEYFWRTRKELFGMELDELEKTQGGDKAWEAATPGLKKLGDLLREKPEGPYFLGKTVSYADFVAAAFIYFAHRTLGDSAISKVREIEPELVIHYEACSKWFERGN